ncbi:MAG TPA: diacylglycerol kinase family protein [Chitinophagaceae bacterium]|nr:diacylglycerol kinase family protein [Chitinophagaceae bacterium]
MNPEITKFSMRARAKSFKYAFAGIKHFVNSQHNARVHLLATVLLFVLAVFFRVSRSEVIALTFAAGFVWVSELFNTAIEKIMDFISLEIRPEIKRIKDLSAAAVLLAAITALIIGCIVFIPKI